ncbi:MAG: patatin-like protein [Chlorobiaceae bacterium]|nr:patatin-like protein [Chlorobiaceae bacterium]
MSASDQKTEVRFAVVMYGGVSLAIYMNGIAQELLRMVRATATRDEENHPLIAYEKLDAVEKVYRKLAYWNEESKQINQHLADKDASLPRSFKIDIISGTSAGGINGIFLAKALANGQKIDELKKLWITEGDVNLLLNDKKSLVNTGLKKQDMPESLFNSRRMYLKLFQAFQDMDAGSGKTGLLPPLAGEINLFVTTTDIHGLMLPVQLSDTTIYERKYRNVFHFAYAERGEGLSPWNDFNERFNPILAFAARCTSSFPFAFEPMRLCDIDEVLAIRKIEDERFSSSSEWKRFFNSYPDKAPCGTVRYDNRPFGDGGYLDNKPFSYAIDAIAERKSDYPIDRKLIYIEPVPEHPEEQIEKDGKPNAIENGIAALLTLPRRETIREDINRIFERNRLNERIDRIISNLEVDKSLSAWTPAYEIEQVYEKWKLNKADEPEPLWAKRNLNDREWATLDLTDVARRKGPGYVAYQRLEIAAVTDDLGRLLARVAGFDEDSSSFLVFRNMVRVWRDNKYIERRSTDQREPLSASTETLNAYLHAFDITFPIRRLNFLHRQIDRLYRLNDNQLAAEIDQLIRAEATAWPSGIVTGMAPDRQTLSRFRQALIAHKKEINKYLQQLSNAGRLLRSRFREPEMAGTSAAGAKEKFQEQSPVYRDLMKLLSLLDQKPEIRLHMEMGERNTSRRSSARGRRNEIPFGHIIDYFLERHSSPASEEHEEARKGERFGEARIRLFLLDPANRDIIDLVDSIATQVKNVLQPEIEKADSFFRSWQSEKGSETGITVPDMMARIILWSYYRKYSNYDMVIFPILYGTDASEGDHIDVIRVSPEDAKMLIDESNAGLHKLAGRNLGNFGAFMEKRWRQNDILWGQLDGAERIISALVSDREEARKLTVEAQAAIACETIAPMGTQEACDLLVEPFMHTESGQPDPDGLSRYLNTIKENAERINQSNPSQPCSLELFDVPVIRDHYLRKFPFNKGLEPENALKNAARATTITSKILSGITDQYHIAGKKYLTMAARAGQLMLWLVDAAVPRSMKNLVTIRWIELLYLLEVLLIVSSVLVSSIRTFAVSAFALTLALHLVILWLRDTILHRQRVSTILKWLVKGLVILVLLFGIFSLVALTGIQESWWSTLFAAHNWFSSTIAWLRSIVFH